MKTAIDQASVDLLRTLDALGMPSLIVDDRFNILAVSDLAPPFFEFDEHDMIGRGLDRFLGMDTLLHPSPERHPATLLSETVRTYCFRRNSGPVVSRISWVSDPAMQGRALVVVRDAPALSFAADTAPAPSSHEDASQVELINELSGIINSSLSIGTIFRMVVTELRKFIQYNRASLLLFSEDDDRLTIFALDTEMKTAMKKGVRAPIIGTSAGWVVRNNKPWISRDLRESSFPLDRKLLAEGIRSTISIPLFHNRMLGVFNFDSGNPAAYTEKDIDLLLPIAKHIAVALENALLFEEISKEKKEWERTFDAITDMVWIEDSKQRIIRANSALLRRTGLALPAITGRQCGDLLDRFDIVHAGNLCSATLSGKAPSFLELKSAGGGIYHFWAYPLFDEEGKLYAIVHYLKDVTAQKRLEQQLIRSDKLASLGTLVAGIAHEINNPLGIIAGYSEALLDRSHDASLASNPSFGDFPEYLRTIHAEIFRCKGILKSLLEFARPSGGTFRDIDINELIKEVLLLLQHRTSRLKHSIELDLNRDLPKVHADAGSLRQLVINLLLNAIYFTPEGGRICIRTAKDDPARVVGVACTDRILLSVADTGCGIPTDLIGKVFDPFFTTKPVGEGTGLGLTICHRIVEEHGGAIEVESMPGTGTTFTITLPSVTCND